jgi:hypothetical protein
MMLWCTKTNETIVSLATCSSQLITGLICIDASAMLNKQLLHKSNNLMMTECY